MFKANSLVGFRTAERVYGRYSDVVLSNDLHSKNILVNDSHRLSGIIDFTDCAIGNPFLEFRHFYRISPQLFEATVGFYCAKQGWPVETSRARIYYLATEFSRLIQAKEGGDRAAIQAILERLKTYVALR